MTTSIDVKRTMGVLLGMVAGDAYFHVGERIAGKYTAFRQEVAVKHGPDQVDYCQHKCALVNALLGTAARVNEQKNNIGSTKYKSYGFSASSFFVRELYSLAYTDGKIKTFNRMWLNLITNEGLALWYMDDGSAKTNTDKNGFVKSVATEIATCCSRAEADIIAEWFWDKHQIQATVFTIKATGSWSIRLNTTASAEFAKVVQPFMIPSMLYKLRHVANLSSQERQDPSGVCSQCGADVFDNRRGGYCTKCYSNTYYALNQAKCIATARRYRERRVANGWV
jgi:hypothetical protein